MIEATVLIPVLNRPERVKDVLWSLRNGLAARDYDWLFIASPEDSREVEELRRLDAPFLAASWPSGMADWARKINLGYRESRAPWILAAADDLCWCPSWLDRALECAEETGAGVVGTNDLGSPRVTRGHHSCHPLVRRSYVQEHGTIDEPGKVVSEAYSHNFVDDELVATAKARGQWAFCEESMVEHLHPSWHKGADDETYRKGQARFGDDRRLFQRRSALWA